MSDLPLRSEIVTRRTYNRPLDEAGTVFETWEQTVARVIRHQRWLWERAKGKELGEREEAELDRLRGVMLRREGSVAGRTLWLGGTEIAKERSISNFNCFAADTSFFTLDGIKSFAEFEDGDTVQVWTHEGRWRNAVVRCYGEQPLNVIEFKIESGSRPFWIRATPDHRWFLRDGTIATSLKPGDRIMPPKNAEWHSRWNTFSDKSAVVVAIAADKTEPVWCLEVEDDASFTLSVSPFTVYDTATFGLVTGNCTGLVVKTVYDVVDVSWMLLNGCFSGDTPVQMADGSLRPISEIREGDRVMSYDETAMEYVPQTVLKTHRNPAKPMVRVTTDIESTLVCTADHRFLTDVGWVEARYLGSRCALSFFSLDGRPIDKIEHIDFAESEVYDLTVENTSTYLVGYDRLVAHNSGVGFMPESGVLNGFTRTIDSIEFVRSTRTEKGGAENNTETWLADSKTWIIQVGDSAKAWAKAIGKLIAGKKPARRLVIDLSQIRPAGQRLKGYGWISSGDEQLCRALAGIANILNRAVARLLTAIEIMDIVNWIGTILSSRRSAELAMLSADHAQWKEFATAKRDHFELNPQRAQSNNSLILHRKPTRAQLREIFALMVESGGSEPGIINGAAALERAPDFRVLNPCVTGDTQILTSTGYRAIVETVGEKIGIWNGEEWAEVTPFSTGVNPVYRVMLSDGTVLVCTANHRWLVRDTSGKEVRVETQNLTTGDDLIPYPMPDSPEKPGVNRFVQSIMAAGEAETFCFTEPKTHRGTFNGIVTGQCGESLLGDKSLCNLVETNLSRFNGRFDDLLQTIYLLARANYRQTCVNLDDGVLQRTWDEFNSYLHLCGVGLTGYVQWEHQDSPDRLKTLYRHVREGTDGMAEELDLPYSKRVTLIKPSGCRPWYALVTTEQGIFSMDELFVDHLSGDWCEFKKDIQVIQPEGNRRIIKTYDNGMAPIIKINMVYGMSLESTPEHLWKVIGRQVSNGKNARDKTVIPCDEWVRADQLQVDDVIHVAMGVYRSDRKAVLSASRTRRIRVDASPISPPEYMSEDLAWWLGYLWGNGAQSESGKRTRFMSGYKDHIERVAELTQSLFGLSVSVKPASQGRNAWACDISSSYLWCWLETNGFFKYGDFDGLAHIPLKVRQSSTEIIIAFIAGLFDADGCACQHRNKKNVTLSYTTADAAFAQHFQDVAWAVGLGFGRSHNTGRKNLQRKKSMWLLSLGAAVIPESFELFKKHSLKMRALPEGSRFNSDNYCRSIIGKVSSIEQLEPAKTYDIEVDQTHWYYSGAVKSHNSISKALNCTEGVHKPLGRYIFNNVNFSKHDPLVRVLQAANYHSFENPYDSTGMVVRIPVSWDTVQFDRVNGMDVNLESAIAQLERYRVLMENYVDHNVSITVSYDPSEIEGVIEWLDQHWDTYVSATFLPRNDPTKTAADFGYPYLPQEVVSKEAFEAYTSTLKPVSLSAEDSFSDLEDECAGGMCPVR